MSGLQSVTLRIRWRDSSIGRWRATTTRAGAEAWCRNRDDGICDRRASLAREGRVCRRMVVFVEIDGHASLSTDDINRLPEEAAECGCARVAQYLAYDSTLGFAVRAHIAGPQVIRFWSLVVIAVGVAMSSASGAQAACSA